MKLGGCGSLATNYPLTGSLRSPPLPHFVGARDRCRKAGSRSPLGDWRQRPHIVIPDAERSEASRDPLSSAAGLWVYAGSPDMRLSEVRAVRFDHAANGYRLALASLPWPG